MNRLKYGYVAAIDVPRAVGFYTQVLGLKLKFQDGGRWAQFDAQGADFAIACPEEAAAATVLVFEVDDLPAAARRVEAAGGRIESRRDMGSHGSVLIVRDLDGNTIQLYAKATEGPHPD